MTLKIRAVQGGFIVGREVVDLDDRRGYSQSALGPALPMRTVEVVCSTLSELHSLVASLLATEATP